MKQVGKARVTCCQWACIKLNVLNEFRNGEGNPNGELIFLRLIKFDVKVLQVQ